MIQAWLTPEGNAIDLAPEVARKAAALAGRPEKFLLIETRDPRDAATWILASFRAPLAAVPIPAGLPAEARAKRLAQLPAGSFVHATELTLPAAATLPPEKPRHEIWAVVFTSGSSGQPKGVALPGAALAASAEAHARHSGHAATPWLLDLPLYHVGGLSILGRAHFLGAPFALAGARFEASQTAAWIASGHVRGLSLVPTTLYRLLETAADLSRLEILLLGGAAADPALVVKARGRRAPVRLTYGMTEHASQIATETGAADGLRPLPGVEIKIVDGEILVRSPCLAAGYYQNGALAPLPLENGFLRTGDLGRLQDGRLTVEGRKSELIVSGGKKIFPGPIEAALAQLPGVEDCAVTAVPDPEWGEKLCALVVGGVRESEAREFLAQMLERHEIPKVWIRVTAIPRSGAGKILRSELAALWAGKI